MGPVLVWAGLWGEGDDRVRDDAEISGLGTGWWDPSRMGNTGVEKAGEVWQGHIVFECNNAGELLE